MKDDIKRVATELLIRHGYQGFRFRDVADALGITRANVHHHYGNKLNLTEEVVVVYVYETLAAWEVNWTEDKSFAEKIGGMMESNRRRYLYYNPTAKTANPWSLIGRMRMDRALIGPQAQEALKDFAIKLNRLVVNGIEMAVAKGEFSPDIPHEDIALQLVAIADSAGPIVQDGGDFRKLEQLYSSFSRIVYHAYGLVPAAAAEQTSYKVRPQSRLPQARLAQTAQKPD
jgi:AcrR family transcriptional regulator